MRFALVLMLSAIPATTLAQSDTDSRVDSQLKWGVNIWGLSYHINRSAHYNEKNWGLGIRYSARPRWMPRASEDNQIFIEVDALRNSHNGLVVPISTGAEYKVGSLSRDCKLFVTAALTVAYYRNPASQTAEVRFGPVPGFAIGYRRIKSNVSLVPSPSRQVLAAVTASMTIAF